LTAALVETLADALEFDVRGGSGSSAA